MEVDSVCQFPPSIHVSSAGTCATHHRPYASTNSLEVIGKTTRDPLTSDTNVVSEVKYLARCPESWPFHRIKTEPQHIDTWSFHLVLIVLDMGRRPGLKI